jgi:NADPH-dependent glutamate synthase beta subunit-like oxidoreductase
MTPKELGELGRLERAVPRVDPTALPEEGEDALLEPGLRKSVNHLRSFAAVTAEVRAGKSKEIAFEFFAAPKALLGQDKVGAIEVGRTRLEGGRAVATGEVRTIPCDLVVSCIGYVTSPIAGIPFDEREGRFANDEGRIVPGLYCVGWARRGPTGTIGTNRPDGYSVIERIAKDVGGGGGKHGRAGFDALAQARELDIVTFRDWLRIEAAEAQAAREGSPREKFTDIAAMIAARRG